ncbi:ABC transporter B family member 3-like isoform X1 [Panicum miliaceum]|uniref:ABC transporter B family member 3-like isoform X1 n=1 Tax=Panicum miliaceum TaxID=4540 RepID=A0A3L6R4N0_PANMI|nr:ABC transporter B family member 3-like isoform X1 [Panicum miliaceum]
MVGRRGEGAEDRSGRVGYDDAAGGDGGGGRGAGAGPTKPPVAAGRVPLHRLFAFADRTDALLMAVGALTAVANGMAQPLMTFIFGDVIDAFGSAESSNHVLHRVVKVPQIESSKLSYCFI